MNCKMLCCTFRFQKITQKQRLVYKRRRNFEVGFPLSKLKECEWLGSNYTARWPKNEYHCLLLKEQAKENHVNVALFLIAQSPLSFSSPPTLKRCATEIALPSLFALSNYPCELSKKRKKKKEGRKGREEKDRKTSVGGLCGTLFDRGGSWGRVQGVCTPSSPWDDLRFSNTTGILQKYIYIYVVNWCWSRARDECTPS